MNKSSIFSSQPLLPFLPVIRDLQPWLWPHPGRRQRRGSVGSEKEAMYLGSLLCQAMAGLLSVAQVGRCQVIALWGQAREG